MHWRRIASLAAMAVAAMASTAQAGGSQPLCSIPPGSYAQAKQQHPEMAFALTELEKRGIASWYTDRAGNPIESVKEILRQCGEETRVTIVVYGLPNKDCEARESMGGSNRDSAAYQQFISALQQTVGNRNVLYVIEPDAVALLAHGGCAKNFGYEENLGIAVKTLSQNPNADLFVDLGHWMLESEKNLGSVTAIMRRLLDKGRVKGVAINTSNYRSNQELSGLCGKFRGAMGGADLKCIVDTSRNYNGPSGESEWCNYKDAAIGKLPTGNTGDPNIDYYVWIKPPGESDGRCESGRTKDTMPGAPGAGSFFPEYMKSLWNRGAPVKELGMPPIDGTVRQSQTEAPPVASTPAPTTTAPAPAPSPTPNATIPTQPPASTPSEEHEQRSTGSSSHNGTVDISNAPEPTATAGVVVAAPVAEPEFKNTMTDAPTKQTGKDSAVQTISNKSGEAQNMSAGFIVLLALVGAAFVALVAVVAFRVRQRKLEETKTPLEPRIYDLRNTPSTFATL